MSWRGVALAASAIAALGIVWAYALDAALPDEHADKTLVVHADTAAIQALTGTVDYAELGYPGVPTADPAARYPLLPPVVVSRSAELSPLLTLDARAVQRANDESTAWIWLLLAAVVTALAALAAAFLWRRHRAATATT